ncbi:MAG TPA: M56 family metallopeptidase, partial [Segetibacter sp.]|nr:M56 family metallopeptidase [Segetibacter sp.]
MLAFAWYLLKVMLVSGILFSYYWLALRNKRFHLYNRFYLLVSVILSWIIPLIKISVWEESMKEPQVVTLLTVVTTGDRFAEANTFNWNWNLTIIIAALSISAIFFAQLLIAIVKIKTLISSNPTKKWNDINFVFTNVKGTPFSFFKYVFWNNHINLNSSEGEQILKHELAHVHEKHSAEKIFLNALLIIGWYNPFVWLVRKELNMIHEFIADQKAVNEGDVQSFALMLLHTAYPAQHSMIINSFFHSPIKRRLLMLTSSRKTSFTYLRRIAVLPLLAFTYVLFAFTIKKGADTKSSKQALADQVGKSEVVLEGKVADTKEDDIQDTTFRKKANKTTRVTTDSRDTTVTTDAINGQSKTAVKISSKDPKNNLNKTLVVLDGIEMSWQEFENKGVKGEEIQSMNVLKDKYATDKYGDKGNDGVIEITSKQSAEQIKNSITEAQFPGGLEEWRKYIFRNTNFKVLAESKPASGKYTVTV